MKTKINVIVILIVLFILPVIGTAQELAKDKFVIGGDNDPPFIIIENNIYSGIYAEMFEQITKGLDLEIEIMENSFSRNLKFLETGELDGFLTLLKTAEREKFLYYCEPPVKERSDKVFYFRKGSGVVINKYEDLYKYRIGVIRGFRNFERFDNDSNIKKEYASTQIQNFKKLAIDRIDVVIRTETSADYFVKMNYDDGVFEKAKYKFSEKNPVYFVISRKSGHMKNVKIFEENLKKLFDDNWYQSAVARWIK